MAPSLLSLSLPPSLEHPPSLASSQRFIPFMLMEPPHHHHHHHVYLIKNQLKTPRRLVSRAEARLRLEQKRFPHSLPLSLTLTISSSLFLPRSPSLSPTPLAPPSCLLEVGNMIYENGELNLYIFFLLHPLIYLLDFFFSPSRLFLSLVWRRGRG